MIISHNIKTHKLQIVSNYAGGGGYQIGFVFLFGENNIYIGHLGIIKDGQELPENRLYQNGVLNIYFNESELQSILNTLKNQNSVALKFNTDSKWGAIETSKEAIGSRELVA